MSATLRVTVGWLVAWASESALFACESFVYLGAAMVVVHVESIDRELPASWRVRAQGRRLCREVERELVLLSTAG